METKITVLVSEDLRRQAKAAAALHGRTLSDVVREMLESYVGERLDPRMAAHRAPRPHVPTPDSARVRAEEA